jgi:hypothetical protein
VTAQSEARDAAIYHESIIAAILTVGALGSNGSTPEWAVKKYAETLSKPRSCGGPINPSP